MVWFSGLFRIQAEVRYAPPRFGGQAFGFKGFDFVGMGG